MAQEMLTLLLIVYPTQQVLWVLAELNYQLSHSLSSKTGALNAYKPSQLLYSYHFTFHFTLHSGQRIS